LPSGYLEEVRIAQATEAWVDRGARDVLPAISESFGDLSADLLVEEELHAKAACSRCQAARVPSST
jgi:hypothetical protein